MKLSRITAILATVAVLALSGAAASSAAPLPETKTVSLKKPNLKITGGNRAKITDAPFAALLFVNGEESCSGVQIAPSWVLTAQHCIDNVSASQMSVQLGAAEVSAGTRIKVKRDLSWVHGDMALLELAIPYKNTYAPIAKSDPDKDTIGKIYGWGAIDTVPHYPNYLKTALVSILGTGSTEDSGPAIFEKGFSGQALWGDSGGPLLVGGKLVGIDHGLVYGKKGVIGTTEAYTSVIAAAPWITSVTGVSGS